MHFDKNMQLHRHHDDEYIDEITIRSGDTKLVHLYLVPRFKTSGLSGDEWRISSKLEIFNYDGYGILYERNFSNLRYAKEFLPHFVYTYAKSYLDFKPAKVEVFRKNNRIWAKSFKTFGEASIGLPYHITVAGESDPNYKFMQDSLEQNYCQQPGCAEFPDKIYKLKKKWNGSDMVDFYRPSGYVDNYRYIWFCERHLHRGDCSMEDCDKNYEVVGGGNSQSSAIRVEDESPSILAGIIEIDE